MSTLPFLLSVADELDNIHSQSYMDDFGLGFHPHRQYYRTPTIQLSLPASTDWMSDRQRCRTHRFYGGDDAAGDNENNADDDDGDNQRHGGARGSAKTKTKQHSNYDATAEELAAAEDTYRHLSASGRPRQPESTYIDTYGDRRYSGAAVGTSTADGRGAATASGSGSSSSAIVTAAQLHAQPRAHPPRHSLAQPAHTHAHTHTHGHDDDLDNIDNSVRMYNLSKKCCKNYYRHAAEIGAKGNEKCSGSNSLANSNSNTNTNTHASNSNCSSSNHSSTHDSNYRLQAKCFEGNISSSEESLQKISSPIEFLTCFLVKKTRTPKQAPPPAASTPTPAHQVLGGTGGVLANTGNKKS